jgi:hypothetical protein
MNENLFPQVSGMLPEDFIPPEYKLIQKTTAGVKGQPGQFWHSLRQESKAEINALVLKLSEVRTKWGRSEISSDPPECASDNAASFKSRDGQNCLECAYRCDNPWNYSTDERREMCLKGFLLLGIDLDEGEPFVMRLSGISALPMREFATNLRFRAVKNKKEPLRISLKAESKNTQYGESFFVQPTIISALTEDEVAAILPLATEFLALPSAPVPKLAKPEEKPADKTLAEKDIDDLFGPKDKQTTEIDLNF